MCDQDSEQIQLLIVATVMLAAPSTNEFTQYPVAKVSLAYLPHAFPPS